MNSGQALNQVQDDTGKQVEHDNQDPVIIAFMARILRFGKKTLIMGVLNVTPDSFSDGGLYIDPEKAVGRAKQMVEEGADIVDVGGESTRPESQSISVDQEIARVIPVIREIKKVLAASDAVSISIDSYKSEVVRQALLEGASIVNSLGGFLFDDKLISIVREFNAPIIIYHIKGKPKTMQKAPVYKDVVNDIMEFFREQIKIGVSKGLKREQFLIDPGIGFGKTVEQNLEIIKRLSEFGSLKLPIVIGVSRKSHLGMILKDEVKFSEVPSPTERLEASLAETAVAVLNGAKIVRTHDVLQTKKFLAVLDRLK